MSEPSSVEPLVEPFVLREDGTIGRIRVGDPLPLGERGRFVIPAGMRRPLFNRRGELMGEVLRVTDDAVAAVQTCRTFNALTGMAETGTVSFPMGGE